MGNWPVAADVCMVAMMAKGADRNFIELAGAWLAARSGEASGSR
jgi:hypothetical protein